MHRKQSIIKSCTCLAALILCISPHIGHAQEDTNIDAEALTRSVIFVGQIPEEKQDRNSRGPVSRMVEILIGKQDLMLYRPMAVCATERDDIRILDQENAWIVDFDGDKFNVPRAFVRQKEPFPSLVGMCPYPGKGVFLTDSRLNAVFLYLEAEDALIRINDSVALKQPTGIAYSSRRKEIWIAESAAHRISVLDERGNLIKQIGDRGINPGQFNFPTNLWIDSEDLVYVVDALNYRIQVFSPDGVLLRYFGEPGDASGYFARPKGVATDSHGNIYVVDALFHTVQIFDSFGTFLYYFGSQGHGEGQFWMPTGIWIDEKDYIYIADAYNSRIQIFKLINTGQDE